MRGLYLCAREHRIEGYDIDYNDIEPYDGINLCCSCEDVSLDGYDFVIATPPCNYYSKANYRREYSKVAQMTKHLLPAILERLRGFKGAFLVENVQNASLLPHPDHCLEFVWGNHTWYTNRFFAIPPHCMEVPQHKAKLPQGHRDGNENVDIIIKCFLDTVVE